MFFKLLIFIPLFFLGCASIQPQTPLCKEGAEFINGECIDPLIKRTGVVIKIECVPLKCEKMDVTVSLEDGSEFYFQTTEDYFLGQIIEVNVL